MEPTLSEKASVREDTRKAETHKSAVQVRLPK